MRHGPQLDRSIARRARTSALWPRTCAASCAISVSTGFARPMRATLGQRRGFDSPLASVKARYARHDMLRYLIIVLRSAVRELPTRFGVRRDIRHRSGALGGVRAVIADLALLRAHRQMQHALCAYAVVLPVLAGLALWWSSFLSIVAMFAVALALLPLVEYMLHRYALHPLLYLDSRFTARVWIRIHYAHHDQPAMSDVILASPASLLTIIAVACIPIALIKPALAFAGAFGVVSAFLVYEIVHFLCHLPAPLATRYFAERQRLHMLHHFHNENYNYGICFSIFDRLTRTHAGSVSAAPRSATVRNLGYNEAKIQEKPLVRLEYERRYRRR